MVSCEKCQEMKELGYPRPDCEVGCLRPQLNEFERAVWSLVLCFFPALILSTGWGGWGINVMGIKIIAREYAMDSEFEFMLRVMVIANALVSIEKEGAKDNG